ncbi:MAG: hypothetical protein RSC35_07150, partial [Mucinivorans sp.]
MQLFFCFSIIFTRKRRLCVKKYFACGGVFVVGFILGIWGGVPALRGSQFRKTKFFKSRLRKTQFPRAVKKNEVFQEKFWVT